MQGVISERRTVKIISFKTCLDYEGYILSDKDYSGLLTTKFSRWIFKICVIEHWKALNNNTFFKTQPVNNERTADRDRRHTYKEPAPLAVFVNKVDNL